MVTKLNKNLHKGGFLVTLRYEHAQTIIANFISKLNNITIPSAEMAFGEVILQQ